MLEYENKVKEKGFDLIVGIDEAGRGPLAGPVVASAVAVRTEDFQNKICDSKKISASKREKAFCEIYEKAYVGVGVINELVIDQHNILRATFYAMRNAVEHLVSQLPEEITKEQNFKSKICLLVDGDKFMLKSPYPYKTVVGGDNHVFSISCASIVAKVTRDRMIAIYDKIFPEYGFKKHKGYGTLQHRLAIREFGPSEIHRKTFKVALP
ncbi:MAG: ribonuclease HII [Candidatus Zapsychrus exili]|nr:ribonuclease HII [Candidatus Zapsychrus exili]